MSFDYIFNLPSVGEVLSKQIANENENERVMKQKRLNQELVRREKERRDLILVGAYKTRMREAIQDAIHELMNSRVKFCTQLNLSSKERLVVDDYYGTDFHVVHYGGKPKFGPYGSEWRNRVPNPLFVGLFKELQILLLEQGYYLLDISDPSKSFAFVVTLYLGKPTWYDNAPVLWHGLNKV
jgi:hypothetical protein